MIKGWISGVVLCVVLSGFVGTVNAGTAAGTQKIEQYAKEAATAITDQIKPQGKGLKTIIMPFAGQESESSAKPLDYSSNFNEDERYFETCLFDELVKAPGIRVVTRTQLEKVLAELKLQMQDIFDPETAKEVGKFMGADLIVLMEGYIGDSEKRCYGCAARGYYQNNVFFVRLMSIDVETAEVAASWRKKVVERP